MMEPKQILPSRKICPEITQFLRDMISIPSESCQEKGSSNALKRNAKSWFDEIKIDKMGNI